MNKHVLFAKAFGDNENEFRRSPLMLALALHGSPLHDSTLSALND